MRIQTLASMVVLILTACTATNSPVNNILVVGSVRGPLYVPHSYVINTKGVELKADLPFNSSSQAEWSRDHRWIASATGNPNKSEIILFDVESNFQFHLTDYRNGESYSPTWSPEGYKIAYFSYDQKGDKDGIYITDISCILDNPKCNPKSAFLVSGYSPSWSPDGQRIVYESFDHQIATLKVDQPTESTVLIADKTCQDPRWSPTEKKKIVVSCFQDNNIDIFTVSTDGSDFTNLTKSQGTNTKPMWSPDGQIAFVSDRDTAGTILGFNDTVRSNSVYLMNSDGSSVKRITTRNNENIQWLTWVYP